MKEKDLVRQCKAWLELQQNLSKLYFIRNNTGAVASGGRYIRFGKKGSSDFIVFLKGKVLFIEAKSDKGTMEDSQIAFKDTITKLGYEYHIIRSLDEMIALI